MGGKSTVQRAVDSWHMNESCPYDLDNEQNKQIQAFMTIYLKDLTDKGQEKEKKPTVLENPEEQLNPKMRKRLSVELGRTVQCGQVLPIYTFPSKFMCCMFCLSINCAMREISCLAFHLRNLIAIIGGRIFI